MMGRYYDKANTAKVIPPLVSFFPSATGTGSFMNVLAAHKYQNEEE